MNKFFVFVVLVITCVMSKVSIEVDAMIPTSRSELYTQLKWSMGCENQYKSGSPKPNQGLSWMQVTKTKKILTVLCDQSAYQSLYEMVDVITNWSGTNIIFSRPIKFYTKTKNPAGVISDLTKNQLLGNPIISLLPTKIKNLEKGRGLGDCGLYEEFKPTLIVGRYNATVVKIHDECDGNTNTITWTSLL
jgi:hypothetical protein